MAYAKKPIKKPGKGDLVPPRERPINRPKPPMKPKPPVKPKPPMKPKPKRGR